MNETNIQKQLTKLRRNKKFLWLGILFLVLVIIWILTSIFATTKTSTISQELRDLSKPFVPRLESKAFDDILAKRAFSDEELAAFSIFIVDKNNVESNEVIIDIMAPVPEIEEIDEEVIVQPDVVVSPVENIQSSTSSSSTTISTTPSSVTISPTDGSSATTPFIEFAKENY